MISSSFLPEIATDLPDRPTHLKAAISSTLIAGLELAREAQADLRAIRGVRQDHGPNVWPAAPWTTKRRLLSKAPNTADAAIVTLLQSSSADRHFMTRARSRYD